MARVKQHPGFLPLTEAGAANLRLVLFVPSDHWEPGHRKRGEHWGVIDMIAGMLLLWFCMAFVGASIFGAFVRARKDRRDVRLRDMRPNKRAA
jgi:hypothetical protein